MSDRVDAIQMLKELVEPPVSDRERKLVDLVKERLHAPSGEIICACLNRNAVASGMEQPCWYCRVRAALQPYEGVGE
jgi:hypothetical protein